MTAVYLTDSELLILHALEDGRWHIPSELAHSGPADALHVQVIRGRLRELARRHLVERGGWGDSTRWGEWRITNSGTALLNHRRQLAIGGVDDVA